MKVTLRLLDDIVGLQGDSSSHWAVVYVPPVSSSSPHISRMMLKSTYKYYSYKEPSSNSISDCLLLLTKHEQANRILSFFCCPTLSTKPEKVNLQTHPSSNIQPSQLSQNFRHSRLSRPLQLFRGQCSQRQWIESFNMSYHVLNIRYRIRIGWMFSYQIARFQTIY